MKSALTLLIGLFSITSLEAQITITKNPIVVTDTSKTIFIYRVSDTLHLDKLKKVIDDNWSYNEIEFMSIDSFARYKMRVNDFLFMFDCDYQYYYSSSTGGHESAYFSFDLTQKKQDEPIHTLVSSTPLSVSEQVVKEVLKRNSGEAMNYDLYKKHTVFTWNFAYLATIMKTLSDKLPKGQLYSSIDMSNGNLAGLKEKKLYISDAIQIIPNPRKGTEKIINREEAVDEAYDYAYEIVSTEKLNELVASGEDGYVFVFMYQKGYGKMSIVIDLLTMEIIYHDFTYNSAFQKKDITRLNKAINDVLEQDQQ